MPLTRYQIRNEFSLADPELYKAADKDDPEALLEGVAMAGLVGVLRQLGDLAEFAAEIFHDLHEEVMATAARGHGLMARVKQLEAEFPSIEKAFLCQTNHSLFFTNAGVDWHPNMRTEHNLITRGDLPRCVLDSYEECRGPPRLFLLDKFDVAGAGACLKRYSDPSFFKAELSFPELAPIEVQREKKARKVKKKGSRWRNGETPEVAPTSHAKLHQLFLEECIENAYNDPARLVKLKRRQLNESPLDSKSGKSYMQKFLESPSPEHKAVYETSDTPLLLTLIPDNSSESGLEIVEISEVSPSKYSSQGKENLSSSPDAQEVFLRSSMEELNGEVTGRPIVKTPEPTADFTNGIEKDIVVDGESRKQCSIDGDHSDDMISEVDNYTDALTTMGSEMDTDNEYRSKNDIGIIDIGKYRTDSDANEEKLKVQAHTSDSQSVGISTMSDDGNSSFRKGRSSCSYSDTIDNMAEDMPSEGEVAAKAFLSNKICVEIVSAQSIQLHAYSEMQCSTSDKALPPKDTFADECTIPDLGEELYDSCLDDLNSTHVKLDLEARPIPVSLLEPQLDEVPHEDVKTNFDLSGRDGGKNLVDSPEITFADSCEKQEATLITSSAESLHVDGLGSRDSDVTFSSHALSNSSHSSLLFPEKTTNGEVPKTDSAIESCAESPVDQIFGFSNSDILPAEELLPCSTLTEVERNSAIEQPHEDLVAMMPVNLASEGNDAALEAATDSDSTTPMVDISHTCSFKEQQKSDILHNDVQLEGDSIEIVTSYNAHKQNVEETFDVAKGEETCRVKTVGEDIVPCDLLSDCAHNLELGNDVGLDDLATENIDAEDIAVSAAASGSADFDDAVDNATFSSSNLICSPSRNQMNLQEPLSGAGDLATENIDAEDIAVSAAASGSADFDDAVDNTTFSSSNLICSPSRNQMNLQEPLSGAGDLCQGGLESNEVISQECIIESEAREVRNQVEGAPPAGLDSSASKLTTYDSSNLEDDIHHFSVAEPTKSILNLISAPASSELSDQEPESKSPSHLESQLDVASSSTHYLSEKETAIEQSLDQHADQHDVERLLVVEDGSNSLNLLPSQMQSLDHIDQERCFQTSSLEVSQQSDLQDNQEIFPSDLAQPSFGLPLVATKVSLEEMPPLPPLPPMQWRMGRVQNAFPASKRELAEHDQGSFPMIPPYAAEQKGQFGLSALDQGIEQPRNSLPIINGEESSFHLPNLVTDLTQPSPFPIYQPTMYNISNSQDNGIALDRTNPNPFLTLSSVSNESLEYDSIAMEGDRIESSHSLVPPLDTEYTNSIHIPLSSQENIAHSPKQFVPDTDLKVGAFQDLIQNSEREHGNLDTFIAPPAKTEEQSPTELAEEAPTKVVKQFPTVVEEQPQHVLVATERKTALASNAIFLHGLAVAEGETTQTLNTHLQHNFSTSEGEAVWPPHTLALSPVIEDESMNENPTVKPPRPRNPLIDAVAAHDKSKMRKVTERVRARTIPKVDERDSLLEQIRAKSFNLKPAVVSRPSIQQGPKTNLRVAAILEKANAIRQALAGSDEDDDDDGWSDS